MTVSRLIDEGGKPSVVFSTSLRAVLAARRRDLQRSALRAGGVLFLVVACLGYADFFDPGRYTEGAHGIFQIIIREG